MKYFHSLLLLLYATALNAQKIHYVNATAKGSNNGLNWVSAFTNLQTALQAAKSGEQIWVASSTYRPQGTDRTATFAIPRGVRVYGGFAGTETQVSQRNPKTSPSVLDGESGDPKKVDDNYYHVVSMIEADTFTVIDGFTITNGWAGQEFGIITPIDYGGGVLVESRQRSSTPVIENCILLQNYAHYGGGVGCFGTGAVPIVRGCTFERNRARSRGGAFYRSGANTTSLPLQIRGSTFDDNFSRNEAGAIGLRDMTGLVQISKCLFQRDSAVDSGAIMLWNTAEITYNIEQCTFSSNYAYNSNSVIGSYCLNLNPDKVILSVKGCYIGGSIGNAIGIRSISSGNRVNYRVLIEQCVFEANVSISGTAIDMHIVTGSSYETRINRCQFVGNFGNTAIAFFGTNLPKAHQITLANSNFYYNYGLLKILGTGKTLARVVNCNFSRNSGGRFLLSVHPATEARESQLQILNSTIWEPDRNNIEDMFANPASEEVPPMTGYFIDHCILQYKECKGLPSCGKHNIFDKIPVENPFAGSENRYFPYECTPGYNRGSSVAADTLGVTTDKRGFPRNSGGAVDIGPWEDLFPPQPPCPVFTSTANGRPDREPELLLHPLANPVMAGQEVTVEILAQHSGYYRWQLVDVYGKAYRSARVFLATEIPQTVVVPDPGLSGGVYWFVIESADGRKRSVKKILVI